MRFCGVDMARRRNRRWLVALAYLAMLALWSCLWFEGAASRMLAVVLLYTVIFVAFAVFGGYGRWGLIKPFCTKTPFGNPTKWQNDERELHRRDRMHFYSYRVVMAMVLLSMMFTIEPVVNPNTLRAAILLIVMVGMTLPPALMLWLEPDIEREAAEGGASLPGEAQH